MNSRAKVAAWVDVAAYNAVDSGFFCLSFYYIILGELPLASCLVTHWCKRVAAGPNITSLSKQEGGWERWHWPHPFHLIRKATTFPEFPDVFLYFIG